MKRSVLICLLCLCAFTALFTGCDAFRRLAGKNLDMYLDESYDVAHDKVSQFVQIHGITKNDVDSYIREFPIAIFKYYYELRLDDVFA